MQHDERKPLTEELVTQLVHKFAGDIPLMVRALALCRGFEWVEASDLKQFIQHCEKLGYVDTSSAPSPNVPAELIQRPDPEQQEKELVRRKDAYAQAAIFEKLGVPTEQIKNYMLAQELSATHFEDTIDAAHGLAITLLLNGIDTLKDIKEDWLGNEERVPFIGPDGLPIRISGEGEPPKYLMVPAVSADDKRLWQREWTVLFDQLRKLKGEVDNAAKIVMDGQKSNEPNRKRPRVA